MSKTTDFKIHVKQERHYTAFHDLKGTAYMALRSASNEEKGWHYHQMIAITFSALALEALFNAIGDSLYDKWEDFDKLAPASKLRLITEKLGIDLNYDIEPWSAVRWIFSYRNDIVHAKPKYLVNEVVVSEKKYKPTLKMLPESKLEKNTSLSNAKRSCDAVCRIKEIFIESTDLEAVKGVLSNSCESLSSVHFPSIE